MQTFQRHPIHELERLDALHKLNVLDTPVDEAFDRFTRMAAQLFQLPSAAVSLTDSDRQWFKSRVGVHGTMMPRLKAPCAEVTDKTTIVVIEDLQAHDNYYDSPLAASGARFYAGAPLMTQDGYCLGSMCVVGPTPRSVTEIERAALSDLAAMVMSHIELRHAIGRVDPTSGLPNRARFMDDFADLVQDSRDGEERVAVMINLASPEQLSNAMRAMGSSYLDEIIREAVQMLRATKGVTVTMYHITVTEFVFIGPSGTDLKTLREKVKGWVRRRARAVTSRFATTAAVGIVPFKVGATSGAEILRNLHSAAQYAFEHHRLVSVYSGEQDAVYQRRFWLINKFGAALEQHGQLHLVYQPKIDLATGACIGAEALLRWTHPEAGAVPPGEFIPIIEQTTMISATTQCVLAMAIQQLAAWRAIGLELPLAVNVSVVNLLEPNFCASIVHSLKHYGVPVTSLTLEVTESALMKNPEFAHATMAALDDAGIVLAIDDFGTGYSSLAYLQSLPAQVVKIDRSFVRDIESNERQRSLVATMIKLSHDLGRRVVAEGVETAEVARVLYEIECDEAQGYYYARPLESTAFEEWVANWVCAQTF